MSHERTILVSSPENKPYTILHDKKIKKFLEHCTKDSTVALDLDNTVMETIEELGSDQWFVALMNHACEVIIDKKEAAEMVLAIYHAVHHFVKMKAVEEEIVAIIKQLQTTNTPVVALTARGNVIADDTARQLNEIDIDFSKQYGDVCVELDIGPADAKVIFKNGVIYCSGQDKGKCLKAYFDYIKHTPEHLVMIDDKEKYLHSVAKAIKTNFVGLRYGHLDTKVAEFKMANAEDQLEKLAGKLTITAQRAWHRIKLSTSRHRLLAPKPAAANNDKPLTAQSEQSPKPQ